MASTSITNASNLSGTKGAINRKKNQKVDPRKVGSQDPDFRAPAHPWPV